MNDKIDRAFLLKYFEGRATAIQKQQIDVWVEQVENRELFYKYLHEWELSNMQCSTDSVQAWEEHQRKLDVYCHSSVVAYEEAESPNENETKISNWLRRNIVVYFSYAAAIFLLVLGGTFLYHKREAIVYESYVTNANETKKIQLSDGSDVVLNRMSKLLVPRFNFGKSTRIVKLIGDAKFYIKHTDDHQKFVVNTPNGVKITVLGTVFDVYALPKGTRVVLNEGSVQLNFKEGTTDKQLLMTPGDRVTVSDDQPLEIARVPSEEHRTDANEKKIVFTETPLYEVLSILESNYGIQVRVSETSMLSLTVTGSFPVDDVQELMNILVEGAGLKLRTSEDGGKVLTVD